MLKKAQISVFIVIIAIIMLVSISFYFLSDESFKIFEDGESEISSKISDMVTTCLERSTLLGVRQLGIQGGYIQEPLEVSLDIPSSYMDLGVKLRTWDVMENKYPTIESMEVELSEFIRDSSFSCIELSLEAYREFEDVEDISLEEFKVSASINDQNVEVESQLPITVNVNEEETVVVDDYALFLDEVRLGDLYHLAAEIYNLEAETYFLEELVLEQIYSAAAYDSDISMPTEGMSFDCRPQIWTTDPFQTGPRNLRNILGELNNKNFKFLNFVGTYQTEQDLATFFPQKSQEEILDLQQYYESPVIGYTQFLGNYKDSFENYEVDVSFPKTKTPLTPYAPVYQYREFEVSPSSGSSLVRSMDLDFDTGLVKVPIPCVQIYHHLYSLDYDVLVTLRDRHDNSGNFVFQFPLRISIDKNFPKQTAPLSAPISLTGEEQGTYTQDEYCGDSFDKYQKVVKVFDASSNQELSGVNISYSCVTMTCNMGQTQKPLSFRGIDYGSGASLSAEFPYCIGGTLIAEKEGYHTEKKRGVSSNLDTVSTQGNGAYESMFLTKKKTLSQERISFSIASLDGSRLPSGRFTQPLTPDTLGEDGYLYLQLENTQREFTSEFMLFQDAYQGDSPYYELNSLDLLEADMFYNVTLFYVSSSGELGSYLFVEDFFISEQEARSSSSLSFKIPVVESLDSDNFLTFEAQTKELFSGLSSNPGGFGIVLK